MLVGIVIPAFESESKQKDKKTVIASEVVTSVAISNADDRQNEIASQSLTMTNPVYSLLFISGSRIAYGMTD